MNPLPTRNSTAAPCTAPASPRCPRCSTMRPRARPGSPSIMPRASCSRPCPGARSRERAQVVARKLIGAGFARGERLLITADTWPGFFDSFFGAQYAGLLPVPVSIPVGIGGKDAYLDQLRRQLAASGAVAAVGIDDLAGYPRRRRQGIPGGAPARRHGRARCAAGEAGRPAAARPRRALLHPVLLGQHAPPARRADHRSGR